MYYLNCFFIYSILGYFLETIMALITGNGFKSGILNGWWTPVYGIGAVTILFVSEYLFKNLHMHRFWETVIMFYAANEAISILENTAEIMPNMPAGLREMLLKLRKNSGEEKDG